MLTLIGLITIVILLLTFKNIHKLYMSLVFFSSFSASTVLKIGTSKFGITPAHLLGVMFIFRMFIYLISNKQLITKYDKNIFLILLLLTTVISLSMFNPILLDILDVHYDIENIAFSNIKELSSFGLPTQYIYFLFYMLLTLAIFLYMDSFNKVIMTIKIFLITSTFTILWGLFVQQGSYIFGFEYPSFIFNNHPGYAQGYKQEIYGFVNRMCSVAQEPSVYGFYLTYGTFILYFSWMNRVKLFNKKIMFLLLFLHVFAMIITTSSTSIVSLLIIYIFVIFNTFLYQSIPRIKIIKNILFSIIFIIVSSYILYYLVDFFLKFNLVELLEVLTINKVDEGSSGEIRLNLFYKGLDIFLDTYLIGAGYGINRTVDINTTLLSNIGIIGLFLWLLMLIYPYYILVQKTKITNLKEKRVLQMVTYSVFVSYIIMSLSIPDFVNLYFWLFLALYMSLPKILKKGNKVYEKKR